MLMARCNVYFSLFVFVARFISHSVDADVRRECEQKALDVYFARLSENYAKHNAKPNFTRKQATDFYELASIQ